jgi:hypothetical protein
LVPGMFVGCMSDFDMKGSRSQSMGIVGSP